VSKMSLSVQKVADGPESVLQQDSRIVVPDTVKELTASMNALGSGVMLAGWATAATVYAWTEPRPGKRTDLADKSARLTFVEMAALDIRGLRDRETVAFYRSRWQDAIDAGWAKPVIKGDVVALPAQDFATATELGGLKASTGNEWYTPAKYIEAARQVMGGIDLDPASSALANETVKAETYWDIDARDEFDNDSLFRDWHGRVWLNPPYGKGSGVFTIQLVSEFDAGRVTQAVLLLNAYGFDSDWFTPLWRHPICFTDHRIEFTSPDRTSGGPANGNIFIYLGPDEARFAEVFRAFGSVVRQWP